MTASKPKTRKPSDLKSHTGFWLRFVSSHVSQQFSKKITGSGVTVAEWVILRGMFDVEITSPSALASSMGLTRGAVSKLIDRLHAKKLLTRVEATKDRRFQDVSLTATGRKLVPHLAALADKNDSEFFSHLSPEERNRLVTTLKKLVRANHLSKIPMD